MMPFYFGAETRRLFGIFEPLRVKSSSVGAAVLCYPWGSEYLLVHRAMRQLSSRLTMTRYNVLRFDYFGSGDSAGELNEADLSGWQADIDTAIDEMKDMTGAARVALIGLRIGASLAARVAVARPKEIESLVLWDPIVSGPEYLRELLSKADLPTKMAFNPRYPMAVEDIGEAVNVEGYTLTQAFSRDFASLDLIALAPALTARTLLVSSKGVRPDQATSRLASAATNGTIRAEYVESIRPWAVDPKYMGGLPTDVVQRIVQWLE